jgi:hypothetical protein
MKDSSLTGVESLEVIQSMINKAKNHFSENGTLYLVWGWVVLVCSLVQFFLDVVVHYEKPYLIWMLTWLMLPYMFYFLRKRKRHGIVKTYADDILGYVWNTFVVMLFISFFILFRFVTDPYRYVNIFVLLMYGMPTFLSGTILKFKPLVIGGICCWVLALLSGFVDFVYHPLFIAAAVIIAWIIPGYILKSKYKQANN